jgi:hypothetical protein
MRAFFKQTDDAAIDELLAPKGTVHGWQIDEFRLHLSAAGGAAENLTIKVVSASGEEYNFTLFTQAMAAVADVRWHPDQPVLIDNGDAIHVEYANTNGRTWGLEIVYSVY